MIIMKLQTLIIGHVLLVLTFKVTSISSNTLLPDGRSRSITLTTIVGPGYSDCFYEPLKQGSIINIDYQVLSTGNDDSNDISFQFMSPSSRKIFQDHKLTDKNHEYVVQEGGIHEFCFDNTFSTFSEKVVFFEIYIEQDINYVS